MAVLGKCLLFYLKYPVEMERLWETEPPNTQGLPEPKDATLAKVALVGDTASREAAELLELCAPVVEDRFRPISAIRRRRSSVEYSWDALFSICSKRAKHRRFDVGVYLSAQQSSLIPWVWCGGGQSGEEEMIRLIGRGTRSRDLLEFPSGCIGLSRIPIAVPDNWENPVDAAPLVEKVGEAFAVFDEMKVKELIALASD